jgi:hypothetical protein
MAGLSPPLTSLIASTQDVDAGHIWREDAPLQPNFQYFVHPGGGATSPTGLQPGKVLKDAAVLGLRTVLKF